MSLDGYIADSTGGVDWLTGQSDDDSIDTYGDFVKDIDIVLMGWNTYHQIVTELSPDKWVYDDFTTYVITHHKETSSDKFKFEGPERRNIEVFQNEKNQKKFVYIIFNCKHIIRLWKAGIEH